MKRLVVIAGPTASGKTAVSIEVAKRLNGEVVSADSVQVYKGLDVGSAKIKEAEKENIRHYMIDVVMPQVDYSMVEFRNVAEKCINEILEKNKTPLIVGGTGFYIQSLIRDVEFDNVIDEDTELREKLYNEATAYGNDYIHEKLKDIDYVSYKNIHPNNLKRVIRAIEYFYQTGNKISEHNMREKEKKNKYDVKFFVLYFEDRELLYKRVNKRVDEMVKEGLFDEVKRILETGVSKDAVAMQAIGYKEVIEYLDGILTQDETIEKIKANTRHLVKRQYTWFKHQQEDAFWIPVDTNNYDMVKIADEIIRRIEND